ncbi:MAG: DUF1016 N-terminal domain-containing protein [bacterium]
MKNREITTRSYNNLIDRIANILKEARTKVVREINKTQVLAYWEIGREIVEFEQKGEERAEYGKKTLIKLSKDLTEKFGRGFSVDNLELMRKFYLFYSDKFQISETLSRKFRIPQRASRKSTIRRTLSDKSQKQQTASARFEPMLSWSRYCQLLKVEKPLARSFYEQEATQNNWSGCHTCESRYPNTIRVEAGDNRFPLQCE